MRGLAKKAKFSTGYLPMMIKGKRKLSEQVLERLQPYLKLNATEFNYLQLLCSFEDARSPAEQAAVLSRMQNLRSYSQSHEKEYQAYNYLSHWYYVAIREMINLPHFNRSPEWIQSQLWETVPRSKIQKAISFLEEQGFIELQGEFGARQVAKDVDCMGGIYRLALGQFHREMLKLTSDSIDKVTKEQRHILGHTLTLDEEGFTEAKKIMNEAMKKIAKLEQENRGDKVYHFAATGIPLTKDQGQKDE